MARETAITRVTDFLEKHKHQEFCDACIADRIGMGGRRAVWRATKILGGKHEFTRGKKVCPTCGYNRMLIAAK